MKEIKNVLILGLGAIGSIYATKIYDYNPDCIKVLLDKSRFERYKKDGISFNGKRYDFDYLLESDTNLKADFKAAFKADLIIIATKATDFEKASDMIENFIHDDTIIMSLLNGISSEETLISKYGKEKVLYSYFLGHASMKSGSNIEFDGIGTIFFGENENLKYSKNVEAVKTFFEKLNIDYEIPKDMLSSMWQKFVINVGINQTLTIVNMPYGGFKNQEVRNLANDLMSEAVKIAEHLGIKNCQNFIENTFKLIDSMPPEFKPSMLQDIENQKPTEVDIFAGEVCRLGKKYGIHTPKNEMAFNKIKAIEKR